jgi:hypothetical protein
MIKPIKGTWFEFQHHNLLEAPYWNQTCREFTARQWDIKIKEMAEIGIEYVVLMAVACHFEAYYGTSIFPKAKMGCENPLEVLLNACDKYDVKLFIPNDFFGTWDDSKDMLTNPQVQKRRLQATEELVRICSGHKCFYGWYWPNEAHICGYYSEEFIAYVNECSKLARSLVPGKKILIAPYGTNKVAADDKFVKQLEELDVDIIAYQDEIGVQKTKVSESAAHFEKLRKLHDKVGNRALWADVEIFEFEGEVYKSPLIPADINRIIKQLEAVSSFVDTVLVYQYLGIMNKPGTQAFAGHSGSSQFYTDYVNWLNAASIKGR